MWAAPENVTVGKKDDIWISLFYERNGVFRFSIDGYLNDEMNTNDMILDKDYYLKLPPYDSCGRHYYTIEYYSYDSYGDFTIRGTFGVDYKIDVNISDAYYGEAGKISVDLPSGVKKDYVNITVNGNPYSASIKDGLAFSNWIAGQNTITVTYEGDDSFPTKTVTKTVNVKPKIQKSNDEIIYNLTEAVYLILPDGATGKLTVTKDGSVIDEVNVKGGRNVWIPSTGISYGVNNLEFSYGDYGVENELFSLNVTYNMGIEVYDARYGQPGKIYVNLPDVKKDYVTITVNGKAYTASIKDGLTFSNWKVGDNNITATYEGDDLFPARSITETFNVNSLIQNPNLVLTADDIMLAENATVEIAINPNATGDVIVNVDGDEHPVNITNGHGVLKLSGLKLGRHDIRVRFAGDVNFTSSEKKHTFWVKKKSNLELSVSDIHVGEAATINVTVDSDIKEGVNLTVNGKPYTVELSDGKGSVVISDLTANTYDVRAEFSGNDNFTKDTKTKTFNVLKYDAGLDVSVQDITLGESATVIIKINESATGKITYTFDNEILPVSLTNGMANIALTGLQAGTYNVTVTFEGDGKFTADEATVTFRVNTKDAVVETPEVGSVKSGEEIILKFPADAGGSVVLSINKKEYTFDVKDGKAIVKIPDLANGNFEYSLTYTGDGNYSAKTLANATLSVDNPAVKPSEKKQDKVALILKKVKVKKSAKKLVIKATLKINGKPAKAKLLKFKFKGKTYRAKTNSKGVAKITIKKKVLKKLKVGKKVKYQVTYLKTTKKLTVKVKK